MIIVPANNPFEVVFHLHSEVNRLIILFRNFLLSPLLMAIWSVH